MNEKILVTGGSGFIGQRLTSLLRKQGYEVVHLTRTPVSKSGVKNYSWDIKQNCIEPGALENVSCLVHLAGESMGQRWNDTVKRNILNSRTRTITFLHEKFSETGNFPKTVISSGGAAWYGQITSDRIFTEEDAPGNDFMAQVSVAWEDAVNVFTANSRVVVLRTPLVLDAHEGALPKLAGPAQFGLGAYFGDGMQWVPWIHIRDLCEMYLFALQNAQVAGSYNAVAPENIGMKDFIRLLAKTRHVRAWLPGFPKAWARLVLGEMSVLVTEGSRVDSERIRKAGFSFGFPQLKEALADLYR